VRAVHAALAAGAHPHALHPRQDITPTHALLAGLSDTAKPSCDVTVAAAVAVLTALGDAGCDFDVPSSDLDRPGLPVLLAVQWGDPVVSTLLRYGASPALMVDARWSAYGAPGPSAAVYGCASLLAHPAVAVSGDCWRQAADGATVRALVARGARLGSHGVPAFHAAVMGQRVSAAAELMRLHPDLARQRVPDHPEGTLATLWAWLVRVHTVTPPASTLGAVLQGLRGVAGVPTPVPLTSLLLRALGDVFPAFEALAAGGGDLHSRGWWGLSPAAIVGGAGVQVRPPSPPPGDDVDDGAEEYEGSLPRYGLLLHRDRQPRAITAGSADGLYSDLLTLAAAAAERGQLAGEDERQCGCRERRSSPPPPFHHHHPPPSCDLCRHGGRVGRCARDSAAGVGRNGRAARGRCGRFRTRHERFVGRGCCCRGGGPIDCCGG
jgi:hypothetical protein